MSAPMDDTAALVAIGSAAGPLPAVFEDTPITFHTFRGRVCVIGAELGAALGYADDGRTLVESVRSDWSDDLIDGRDYAVLVGDDLAEFKAAARDNGTAPSCRTARLMVLFESGFDLACLLCRKPAGRRLRRFVASDVLPRLRRGEPITPTLDKAGERIDRDLALREFDAVERLLLGIPGLSDEAKGASRAYVLAKLTGQDVTPMLPVLADGLWLRPTAIAVKFGATIKAIGAAISFLELRGVPPHSKTLLDEKAHAHGQVPVYIYDEHAVGLIRDRLTEKAAEDDAAAAEKAATKAAKKARKAAA